MQNKGFVVTLAVLFALVCAYCLSFTVVSNYYSSKAEEYAEGDQQKYVAFMDSLSRGNQPVWLGHSLKEVREKELNLGLDLRGGMNVVMEVSVPDILKALAGGQSSDDVFVKSIDLAREKQKTSQSDFLTLFEESFNEVNPGGKLAAIFSGFELKNKVNYNSSNSEVMSVLRDEVNSAIDNSFNVLRSRIDRFGVVQPNIQRLQGTSRILIEMPGVKEPERVRKLLQGSADLAFWETTELSEIINNMISVNQMVVDMESANKPAEETAEKEEAKEETAEANISEADSLLNTLAADKTTADTAAVADENGESLFKYLTPAMSREGSVYPGPRVGWVHSNDTAKVMNYLNIARQKGLIPNSVFFAWTVKEEGDGIYSLVALKSKALKGKERKAPLTGACVTDAKADFNDQQSIYASVSMEMNQEGAKGWAKLTRENIGKCVAIVLDGYVYSYPRVNCEISGGRSEITGDFTPNEAKDLANVLKSGKMPAPAKIVQEDVVGPSLGQEAITAGMVSFIAAFVLVLAYMIVYYGVVPGLVADAALICNVFLIFGCMASFGSVLTLPGIAGIVLTLGMAVDANVLIYERIREELAAGKDMSRALADGYSNAMSAIIDANVTTILTGIILYVFGTGPIHGFAITLIIGIVCSLCTAIFISRIIFDSLIKKEKYQHMTFTTKLSENWFKNVHFDFIGKAKPFLTAGAGIAVAAIIALFAVGLKQGIDFSGGRNYTVRFEQEVSTSEVHELLDDAFNGESVSVITIGASNQVRISTNYRIHDTEDNIDDQIMDILYTKLKPLMNNDVTLEQFAQRYEMKDGAPTLASENAEATFGVQSSQKVGPTMADDIKISAVFSIIIALIVIGLYILMRFSKLAYSVGAVTALVHDTLIILFIFAVCQSIMPFSLEIDQSFIAAILTVIGYSINDKVVIFDRIREYFATKPSANKVDTFNNAISSTLSRTFSTSLSTLIVLVIIFFFGGETIRGFIFAMLIGVIVGTYSSIFIASPVACKLYNEGMNEADAAKREQRAKEIADRV